MDLRDQLQRVLGTAYIIERELGGGGMARVFVAEETALSRKVVLKVLAPELAAGVSAERFQREIRLVAALQHPAIIPVHAAGVADGLPYYTMPFVEGQSLRARLERDGALPIGDAVAVLTDIARALAHAHEHGVVHRDIKPDNVLLTGDAAVVADFGIAKALSASRTEAPGGTLTQVGTSLGTPAYMAPEQAAGDPNTDHRADIYAFGCVAYEILTGKAPFAGKLPHQLFMAHATVAPPPVGEARADAPASLATLVMRCLEKDPARRPQSARELLAELGGPASGARGALSGGRSRTRWMAAVAAIVLLGGASSWVVVGRSHPTPAASRSLAVLPFASRIGDTANAYFGDGIAEELITALSKTQGLSVSPRSSSFRFRTDSLDVTEVARKLGVGSVLEGTVRRAGDQLRVTAQLTDVARGKVLWSDAYQQKITDVFAVQDSMAHAIVSALEVHLAGTRIRDGSVDQGTVDVVAYDLYLRGRYLFYQRGDSALRRAIELFKDAAARDPGFARAYAGLSMAYSVLPLYAPVRSDSVAALGRAAGERAIALDSGSAEAQLGVGNNAMVMFEWEKAERHLRRAIALDPRNATAHQWYGGFLSITGRPLEAIQSTARALALEPLVPVMSSEHAYAAAMAGHYDEAVATTIRSSELDSSFVLNSLNLTSFLAWSGRLDSARTIAERDTSTLGMLSRALVYARLNRHADVEAIWRRVAPSVSRGPSRNPYVTAKFQTYLGNRDSAFIWLGRAVDEHWAELTANSIPCEPDFENLHDDSRFAALLRRMGLNACQLAIAAR